VSGVGNADRGDIGLAGLYLTFAPRDRVSTRLASTDAFDDVAGGCLGGGSRQPPAVDRAGGRVNKLDRAGGRTDKGRPQAVPPDQGSIAGGPPGSRVDRRRSPRIKVDRRSRGSESTTGGPADQTRPQAVARIRALEFWRNNASRS
jgi:hypothetical protein